MRPGWEFGNGEQEPEKALLTAALRLNTCSACAGDYEDPDRTAGEEFEDLLADHEAEDCDDEAEE